MLEYLPDTESLNCVNYSETLYPQGITGMKEIHKAGVHHRDIYPRNFLLIHGNPDRLVWIDFDVSTTFTRLGLEQVTQSDYEILLVKGFGEALARILFLPIFRVFNLLDNSYREMTKPKVSHRIQKVY